MFNVGKSYQPNFPVDFPMDGLPLQLQKLVEDVEHKTKASRGLIVTTMLGGISLSCQDIVDVKSPLGDTHPVSLYLLTLADSGERKSTVEKILMAPLYTRQHELEKEFRADVAKYNESFPAWKVIDDALKKKLKNDVSKGLDRSASSRAVGEHSINMPTRPNNKKLILSDVTSAAIKECLSAHNSVGVFSDEAGSLLRGDLLSDAPFLNSMWSGSSRSVDRGSRPSLFIEQPRLSLSLMVQPDLFDDYIVREGKAARASGFFARCLICQPDSMAGSRVVANFNTIDNHLAESIQCFHSRISALLEETKKRKTEGDERFCLEFTQSAKEIWWTQYNDLERQIGERGALNPFKDFVSKYVENLSRITACIAYFEGDHIIDYKHVTGSIKIMNWYLGQFANVFSPLKFANQEYKDSEVLWRWLQSNFNFWMLNKIKKNDILQLGPMAVRKKERLEQALALLQVQGKLVVIKEYGTMFVCKCKGYEI